MKRPKFQFSLIALLVFVTLCSILLARWCNRYPIVGSGRMESSAIRRGPEGTHRHVAGYTKVTWNVERLTGTNPVALTCVIILPSFPDTYLAFYSRTRAKQSRREWGFNYGVESERDSKIAKGNAVLIFDARENTVSLGGTSFPASPDSVYVVHVDDQWQAHLSLDDATLKLPKVPQDVASELRRLHRSKR